MECEEEIKRLKERVRELVRLLEERTAEIETLRALQKTPKQTLVIDDITVVDFKKGTGDTPPTMKMCSSTEQHVVFFNERDYRKIKIKVSLRNEDGNLVTGNIFPLQKTLLYESGKVVESKICQKSRKNKSIRDILTDHINKLEIGTDGTAELFFRIEDVSANHEKQLFVIKLSSFEDGFKAAKTEPIEVKSKHPENRAKRKSRKRERSDTNGSCNGENFMTTAQMLDCVHIYESTIEPDEADMQREEDGHHLPPSLREDPLLLRQHWDRMLFGSPDNETDRCGSKYDTALDPKLFEKLDDERYYHLSENKTTHAARITQAQYFEYMDGPIESY